MSYKSTSIQSLLLCLLMLVLGACQEDNAEIQSKTEALLVWTGEPAADGCGYFIEMNDREYKPENETIIPEIFKNESSTVVIITYSRLNERTKYNCGMATDLLVNGIRLSSIRKK